MSYSEYLTDWYVNLMQNSVQPYLNNLNDPTLNPQIPVFNQAFPQNATTDQIRANILSFNIYYEDLNYNFLSGSAQFNFFILIANIAGVLGGSFLGMSLFSVFEFFEFLLFAIWAVIVHFGRQYKIKKRLRDLSKNLRRKLSRKP
jgi:hypothetical protein